MKKKVIIGIVVLLVLAIIGVGLYFLLRDKKEETPQLSDAVKFSQEYTGVGEDNVFVYRDAEEIIRILKNGTGVV